MLSNYLWIFLKTLPTHAVFFALLFRFFLFEKVKDF